MRQLNSIAKTVLRLGFFMLVVGLALQAHGMVDIPGLETILGVAGGGISMAAAGAAATVEGTTPNTKTAKDAGITDDVISQKITQMRPSANPLDTILRKTRKVIQAPSWQYEFYTSDIRGVQDSLSAAYDKDNANHYISDGQGNIVHKLVVSNPHIWSVSDTGRFKDINGGNSRPLVFRVVKKDSSNSTLYAVAINGTGTSYNEFPDIASGKELTRLGAAKDDLAAQHSPYATYPDKSYNFAQRFMAQVEQGIIAELHKKEINWGYNDYRLQALYDMRRTMELSTLFGERGKIYDPELEAEVYHTGGLTTFIEKAIEYTTDSIANSDFAAWGRDIFQGNSGSDQRVFFAGDDLMVQLAKVGTIEKQLEAGNTKVVYGIRFNRIETSFGELLIYNHELLREVGWSAKGIVLDMNNIDRHVMRGLKTKDLNLDESGQKHAKAQTIEEIFGLALRYPETHAIVQPAS